MLKLSSALFAILLLFFASKLFAQNEPIMPPLPSMSSSNQVGIRFGYQLQFPSKNYVNANNFSFFEAGHYLSYGAYTNLKIAENIQFSPYFGLEHGFWPKSKGYSQDCMRDSFPTFWAVKDSLPGRDFRFYNISFEPSFKFFIPKRAIFFKLQPIFGYNLKRKVESYAHTCGVLPQSQFVDYSTDTYRAMSRFTFSMGMGIVKEVWINDRSGIALEPGVKMMFSRLLAVNDINPNGNDFSLYPWGFYLNLSFFR